MFRLKKLALLLLNLPIFISHAQVAETLMTVPSFGAPLVKKAQFIKPLKSNTTIDFTVWLKLRNKQQLDQLVRELYDPKSSKYQKFLQPGEFNQQYAPSKEIENTVNLANIAPVEGTTLNGAGQTLVIIDAPLDAAVSDVTTILINNNLTFGWDSSMTIVPENQFWNDGVGVGSPNLPNFIATLSTL